MKVVEQLKHRVRAIEHAWIPMSDGTNLAARIWLPQDADQRPVPAIVEYIPYRQRDLSSVRDSTMHPYFAGHGYACLRVDLRGSGDSDGVLRDEYLPQELDDGVELLRWIAAQPWCSGDVGMIGISWGGFNGLQIAALRPPELKAVVSVCSSDDRYTDDVHYMGGCLLGDNQSWAATMYAYNSCPPDPEIVGERWRSMWLERLRQGGLWITHWLEHQRRDAYWRHGSVCEDYARIRCPVLAASGWADGYSNTVFRLLAELSVPRMGLIGPWGHKYPHQGVPGPPIGFLQECVRWWDHWLKGRQTGITEEPMLRVWMQDSIPPSHDNRDRPGRWVSEPSWPSPRIESVRHPLAAGAIGAPGGAPVEGALSLQSPLSVGLFAGRWCSFSATPDLPHDQREEDGGALLFTSEPLRRQLEILGAPIVELELASSDPVAMLAVRLSDVAPDDKATRVTYGLLNLTRRNSHEWPELLEPNRRYRVAVQLNGIAHSFPPAHRLRLSLSTSYWPIAWPPPRPARLTIYTAPSALLLPQRPPRQDDERLVTFEPPESTEPLALTPIEPRRYDWRVVRDLARDVSTLEVIKDEGCYRLDAIDLTICRRTDERYSHRADDFTSARGETKAVRKFSRGRWSIEAVTQTVMTCDEKNFYVRADLDAYEGERRVYCDCWERAIPRDHL